MIINLAHANTAQPVHGVRATRELEHAVAARLPPHALMQRAGERIAQLVKSVAPHARHIWIACGPGNNGGDGFVAACQLQAWIRENHGVLWVSEHGTSTRPPSDAQWARERLLSAGLTIQSTPPPFAIDLGVDALLGIGGTARVATGSEHSSDSLSNTMALLRRQSPVLVCVDSPSDLDASTGAQRMPHQPVPNASVHTLSLLTLKPGLFTGQGRELAGTVWFSPLVQPDETKPQLEPVALWVPGPQHWTRQLDERIPPWTHANHKGMNGDVWVAGSHRQNEQLTMLGAPVLAARAALFAGAGRVTVVTPGSPPGPAWDATQPELMFRSGSLPDHPGSQASGCWVIGCGGGASIADWMPNLLSAPHPMVLDADGLNAIAAHPRLRRALQDRRSRHMLTVITPHPLEAARLLGQSTATVQANRLKWAQQLSDELGVICVLKGSGSVVTAPDQLPCINGTGNARLATGGTGDVLAGLIGASIARLMSQLDRSTVNEMDRVFFNGVCKAVSVHGHAADQWPASHRLTAAELGWRAGSMM